MGRPKKTTKKTAPKTKGVQKKTKGSKKTPTLARGNSLNTELQKAIKEVKETSAKKKTHKLDAFFWNAENNKQVYEDFSCMLNQTNINHNNNKYYVIQLIQCGTGKKAKYHVFTRWGRVGESGMTGDAPFDNAEAAIKEFEKKFKAKSANNWADRENFVAKAGKYTLLEMDESDEEEEEEKPVSKKPAKSGNSNLKSGLDERTEKMLRLIFNEDMFMGQMADMNLDVKKMPLGKLSKTQIAKGLEALIDIEKAIDDGKSGQVLADLSSKFYTLVPHSFGRTVPPVINSKHTVQQKKEVMMVLSDIELTMSFQSKNKEDDTVHPITKKYNDLGCKLEWIDNRSKEFKMLEEYSNSGQTHMKLVDAWRVERKGEAERFAQHDDIEFRKLLWHGTNVAVVAAILNSGLRIMPHSGGRVGRGIYFASDHSKSAGYVQHYYGNFEGETGIGLMFLTEVALGNVNTILHDNSRLTKAPAGYDSVLALGSTEPDPKKDIVKKFDNHDVVVPVGKPKNVKEAAKSHFYQSEYLVYKESQAKIRYVLKYLS